jgi:Rrf2 family iron-sulfur cluster assembly transcriptional regulator
MLDLAVHASDGAVPLADIAERQSLSLAYLEQLFAGLRKAGLVESLRGPGGGYLLARSAAEIRVAEVIAAVDEPVDVTRCGGLVNCNQDSQCLTHDLWVELSRQVRLFFESRSLQDVLLRRAEVRGLVSPSHPGSPPREPRRHIPIVAVP